MKTSDITIQIEGKAMPVYVARPDDETPRPVVIVLQEIFGVNKEVKRIADLFAGSGYVAVAPNYYYRTHPDLNEPYTQEGLQAGFAAAGQVTKANLRTDIAAVRDWANAQPFVRFNHVGVVGFCFGGTAAFTVATLPGISCAVPFYGGHIAQPLPNGDPSPLDDAADLRAPLLLFFGGQDDYIPQEAIERIETALKAAGKRFELQVYPDVGHAFFRESSDALNTKEVADAWDRVQAFFTKYLA